MKEERIQSSTFDHCPPDETLIYYMQQYGKAFALSVWIQRAIVDFWHERVHGRDAEPALIALKVAHKDLGKLIKRLKEVNKS